MNDPTLTLSGNVATDVRMVQTEGGAPFASFRLASTPRRLDRATGRWTDQETIYLSVVCWRSLALNVRDALRKGDPVVVTGRLQQRSWARDGRTGTSLELTADTVGHDLQRGVSRFAKVARGPVEGVGTGPTGVAPREPASPGGAVASGSPAPDETGAAGRSVVPSPAGEIAAPTGVPA